MDDTPPDDCAIEVRYTGKTPFQLERVPSHGPFHDQVCLDRKGDLRIWYRGVEPHRFCFSFRLGEGDTSGGFAGIMVWESHSTDRGHRHLPGRGVTKKIPDTPIDLHVFFTDEREPDKATLLSLGDTFGVRGEFNYCLGIFRDQDRNEDDIAWDDPRIYNNWEPPIFLWWLRWLLKFFRWCR